MPDSTQLYLSVPGVGTVVISSANSLVPAGALAQARGGDEAVPSHVKSLGRLPPSTPALLVSANVPLGVTGGAVVVVVEAVSGAVGVMGMAGVTGVTGVVAVVDVVPVGVVVPVPGVTAGVTAGVTVVGLVVAVPASVLPPPQAARPVASRATARRLRIIFMRMFQVGPVG